MEITAKGLEVSLGGASILKGAGLRVPAGQTVGVIGPNGSGKSTLLRCIYRALKPSGGAVFLDGRPIEWDSVRQSAQKMAVVAQHNAYSFSFTVREIVLMGRSPHKRALERDGPEDYRIVAESLAAVGLEGFENGEFCTLSGGEQQRAVLARALAQQTPCLILDEPTNHLDIQYQLQMMELVRGLGRTVLAAVHDLNIAALYCDALVALKDGEVVGSGPPRSLLTPGFLRSVYGVEAKVVTDGDGFLRILYQPGPLRAKKSGAP